MLLHKIVRHVINLCHVFEDMGYQQNSENLGIIWEFGKLQKTRIIVETYP